MSILLIFAFFSGLVTIAAPCIWPLLPIVLSSSATGGHRKPLGITMGILLSFGFFTLTLSYIVKILPIDLDALRFFAVVVIGFLGFTLLIPQLSQALEGYASRFSGKLGGLPAGRQGKNYGNGFAGGLITGIALGIVWTPCAGPILATIATLAATTSVNFQIVLVTVVYLIGVGIPLFIFATLGRRIFTKTKKLSSYTGRIQQIFGLIMILTAIAIYTNFDKTLQAKLLDLVPSYGNFLIKLESNPSVREKLDEIKKSESSMQFFAGDSIFNANSKAPEIVGVHKWLNTDEPLSLQNLKGKVILVDFWTYTCINCIRTLPHITSWYEKYKDQGFIVLGIHTPEFEFEKNTSNVENAIKQYGIKYPVAQDNNYYTWNAYSNQYWPAKYLINSEGVIRYIHFGEGAYDETEKAIVELLKDAGKSVEMAGNGIEDETPRTRISPETYLGSLRMQYLHPNGRVPEGEQKFSLQRSIPLNTFSFGGEWKIEKENSTSVGNSVIEHRFYGNKAFLVLSSEGGKEGRVKVYLDGSMVNSQNQGSDVLDGAVHVKADMLYNLIDLGGKPGEHILRLEFETPGIKAFAFTFG